MLTLVSVCAGLAASVIPREKVKLPPAVGSPVKPTVRVSDPSSWRPVGKFPEATLQVKGPVPPVAVTVSRYEVSSSEAFPRAAMMICRTSAMRMLRACVLVCCGDPESCTCTVKSKVAVTVGVPLIVPVLPPRLSPSGSAPLVTLQVRPPVPPVACTVWLYDGSPLTPSASEVLVMFRVAGGGGTNELPPPPPPPQAESRSAVNPARQARAGRAAGRGPVESPGPIFIRPPRSPVESSGAPRREPARAATGAHFQNCQTAWGCR